MREYREIAPENDPCKCLGKALPRSILNLRLRGEIRNLICGDSSSLELWIDPLIWSYDSRHVQIDQRKGSSVNILRQFIAPDKASFFFS